MATGTTDFSMIPPSAQALCRKIQKSFPDAPWAYVSPFPAGELHLLQLRTELPTRVSASEVKDMIRDFRAGDEFPPFLAARSPKTGNTVILDGAHRAEALQQLQKTDKRHPDRWKNFHAVVIGWDYEDAPAAIRDQFTMMIARANKHGKRYEKGEIEALVGSLVGDNAPADIARTMGISLATVKAVMTAKKARDKAKELGLDTSGIARTTLEEIARRPDLTEAPFAEVINLAQKTPITKAEVSHLLDRMGEAGTEKRKVELAQAERASRVRQEQAAEDGQPRIGATISQQARMHWAYFLSHEGREGLLVEKNEMQAPEHYSQAARVIGVLRKLCTAQANLEGESAGIQVTE